MAHAIHPGGLIHTASNQKVAILRVLTPGQAELPDGLKLPREERSGQEKTETPSSRTVLKVLYLLLPIDPAA